jgi:hypothetical protein
MHQLIRFTGSVAALAGLVNEGINARAVDPFTPSMNSMILTFLYGFVLLLVNLRQFKSIELNKKRFDFDSHSMSGSMYLIKDRSRHIIKVLGLDVPPVPQR